MSYALDVFERLEQWVEDKCSDYDGGFQGRAAVFFLYLPLFIYFGLTVMAIAQRTFKHVVLSMGMWVVDVLLLILTMTLRGVVSSDIHCNQRVEFNPAPETAIVSYVFSYYLFYALKVRAKNSSVDDKLRDALVVLGLLITTVCCAFATWYLHIYDGYEILIGMLVGVCGSTSWLTLAFYGARYPEAVARVGGWLGLDRDSVSGVVKRLHSMH
jgi:hypothetical protein